MISFLQNNVNDTLMRSTDFCFNKSLKRIVLKIRFHRELASYSQKETAEQLNIGYRSYQRIESGEAICDINFLHRFCYLFNLNFLEFISPYSPVPIGLELFCTEEEVQKFQSLSFIESSHFISWVNKFEKNNLALEEEPEFLNNENPMFLLSSGKLKPNDACCEFFDWKKNLPKRTYLILDAYEKLNFFDCVLYYNPKYLIKTIGDYMKDGVTHKIELYASITHKNDDFIGIFIIKLIS